MSEQADLYFYHLEDDGECTLCKLPRFMLTPQGVLNTGRGSLDTALRIGQKLTTLKLEEATATELWH